MMAIIVLQCINSLQKYFIEEGIFSRQCFPNGHIIVNTPTIRRRQYYLSSDSKIKKNNAEGGQKTQKCNQDRSVKILSIQWKNEITIIYYQFSKWGFATPCHSNVFSKKGVLPLEKGNAWAKIVYAEKLPSWKSKNETLLKEMSI